VEVTEPLGMETLVHFHIGGTPICARVDPNVSAVPGELLPLSADLNHIHLMETATGRVV
jgi:multiple sugar transport system ATP-binding protein